MDLCYVFLCGASPHLKLVNTKQQLIIAYHSVSFVLKKYTVLGMTMVNFDKVSLLFVLWLVVSLIWALSDQGRC